MMTLSDETLLEQVEAFLTETGMAPTRFGREAMGEASFVSRLRGKRSLSLKNANRILSFMADRRAELLAPCSDVSEQGAAELGDVDVDGILFPLNRTNELAAKAMSSGKPAAISGTCVSSREVGA